MTAGNSRNFGAKLRQVESCFTDITRSNIEYILARSLSNLRMNAEVIILMTYNLEIY